MKGSSTVTATRLLLGVLLVACGLCSVPMVQVTTAGWAWEHPADPPVIADVSCVPSALRQAGHGCAYSVFGEDPSGIAISPDGKRAYVVNRSTDNLFVIDTAGDQTVEVIDLYPGTTHPLGPAPTTVAITPDGSRLLVTNIHNSSLSVIDTDTLAVVETLPVGLRPDDVAISPDGRLAYVPNTYDWTVTAIDLTRTEVIETIDVPGGGGPFAVAFAPDGKQAYVAKADAPLQIIDTATHTVIDTIAVTNAGHMGDLVVSKDGTTGYLAALNSDEVVVLDLVGGTVTGALPVGRPESLALSADGSRLYVGTFGFEGQTDYHLWMFDTTSGQLVAGTNFDHPGAPRLVGSDIQALALTPDGSKLYAPSIDGECVFVVDAATLAQRGLIPTIPLPDFAPFRGVLSPDGKTLYVASWVRWPTTVSVIDTASGRVVDEIASRPESPCTAISWGVDLSPDGKTLYTLSSDSYCVLVADTERREIVGHFKPPAGADPTFLAHIAVHPNGQKAYVLEYNGTVFVVDLASQRVTGTVATAEHCSVLKLSPDGRRGYVICSADLAILDLTSDTLLKTIQIGEGGTHFESLFYVGIRPDSAQYVVGAFFDMYVFDAASDTQLKAIDLESTDWTWLTLGQDFRYSPDGSKGYLALPDENAIAVFDTSTWQVGAKIDPARAPYFGTEPAWLQLSADGGTLYVLNELSDNVLTIDTATEQVTGVTNLRRCQMHLPLVLRP